MNTAWEVEDAYVEINPILDRWAAQNHLCWQKEYKGYSVRSYSFPLAGNDSVQFWVDPPQLGSVTVHVAYNSTSKKRRKTQQASYQIEDLEAGLDDAHHIAREWKSNS